MSRWRARAPLRPMIQGSILEPRRPTLRNRRSSPCVFDGCPMRYETARNSASRQQAEAEVARTAWERRDSTRARGRFGFWLWQRDRGQHTKRSGGLDRNAGHAATAEPSAVSQSKSNSSSVVPVVGRFVFSLVRGLRYCNAPHSFPPKFSRYFPAGFSDSRRRGALRLAADDAGWDRILARVGNGGIPAGGTKALERPAKAAGRFRVL